MKYTGEQFVQLDLQSELTQQEWDTLKRREAETGHLIEEWLPELAPTENVFSRHGEDGRRVVGFSCNVVSHFYPEAQIVISDIIRAFCADKSLNEINDIAIVKFPAEHREIINCWDAMLEAENGTETPQ